MINEIETSIKDRVLYHESVKGIYDELKHETSKQYEQSPFSSYKDIFMLAACLGFRTGRKQSLPSGKRYDIRSDIFREPDLALLKAIAIADTGEVQILGQSGEVLRIAEEYAHAGIYEVKSSLLDERGRPLWNLVALLGNG